MDSSKKRSKSLPAIPDQEGLRRFWNQVPFNSGRLEQLIFRNWLGFLVFPFFLLIVSDFFSNGNVGLARLSHSLDTVSSPFLLSLGIAVFFTGFSLALLQNTFRTTFSNAIELGLIENSEAGKAEFSVLSNKFLDLVSSPWRILVGCIAVLMALLPNHEVIAMFGRNLVFLAHGGDLSAVEHQYLIDDAIVFVLIIGFSFGGGLLCWQMLACARWIALLSKAHVLRLQPGHSDNSCGLAPVGMCCLQNALPLMIGIMLCLLWSQASKISIFNNQIPTYLADIHAASYIFIFVQFALACALVFLPLLGLHKTMEAFKRNRDVEFSELLEKHRRMSIEALERNDPDQLKSLSDRLKIVQSFDPVVLRLSTWPFDRANLISFGITPVVGVVTAAIKLFQHTP